MIEFLEAVQQLPWPTDRPDPDHSRMHLEFLEQLNDMRCCFGSLVRLRLDCRLQYFGPSALGIETQFGVLGAKNKLMKLLFWETRDGTSFIVGSGEGDRWEWLCSQFDGDKLEDSVAQRNLIDGSFLYRVRGPSVFSHCGLLGALL